MKVAEPGREDGDGRAEGRENATKCKQKYAKPCSPERHVEVAGSGAQVDPNTVLQGSLGKAT